MGPVGFLLPTRREFLITTLYSFLVGILLCRTSPSLLSLPIGILLPSHGGCRIIYLLKGVETKETHQPDVNVDNVED